MHARISCGPQHNDWIDAYDNLILARLRLGHKAWQSLCPLPTHFQTVSNNQPSALSTRTIKALCAVLHSDLERRGMGLALLEAFDGIDVMSIQDASAVDAVANNKKVGRVQAMANRIHAELVHLLPGRAQEEARKLSAANQRVLRSSRRCCGSVGSGLGFTYAAKDDYRDDDTLTVSGKPPPIGKQNLPPKNPGNADSAMTSFMKSRNSTRRRRFL